MYWSNTLIGLLKPVPLTEPQQFEGRPAESDVSTFLSQELAATGLGYDPVKLIDDGTLLTVAPAGLSLWSARIDFLMPLVFSVVFIVLESWQYGYPQFSMLLVMMFLHFFAPQWLSSYAVVMGLNKRARAGVVRATLDRRQSTLTLHDYGVTLDHAHIDRVVFVKGNQLFEAGETSLPATVGEVSVIGRDVSGCWTRWPVISSTNISRMRTFANHLSRTLNVPQQEVVI